MSVHHRFSFSGVSLLRHLLSIGLISAASIFAANSAQAAVQITIDKNTQRMSVAVDGVPRYTWSVSSGVPSHETPNGTFRAFRMEEDHYSKEWDDAPMPHSIFFTKVGHAIHGTDSVRRLGSPASHGCVRLSRDHAATLYALVEQEGVLNTTVTLTGSAQVALERGAGTTLARGDTAGDPVVLTPRGGNTQQGGVDPNDDSNGVYVDQYGRPLSTNRTQVYGNQVYGSQVYSNQGYSTQGYASQGYAASPSSGAPSAGRRVYQPRRQSYDETDSYYGRPMPSTQSYYSNP